MSVDMQQDVIFVIFLIFSGAAVLSTLALLTRQSMLVAYMLLGIVLGPWGVKLVDDAQLIHHVGDMGILFLLFLLGLNLPIQKLMLMLRKTTVVGLISSMVFALVGYAVGYYSGYSAIECLIIGAAMVFSSTIIGIKLLPTRVLHHQHTGEVMISVLLFQDLLAIAVLLLLHGAACGGMVLRELTLVLLGFPGILLFAYLFDKFVLFRLFSYFSRIKEYLFLLAIAWCLSMAQLASLLGLSGEIGAFIAGVSLASSPVSIYIAESLKPVRDFFLVLFFFAVGANFNLEYLPQVIIPALILTAALTLVKPTLYSYLLRNVGEPRAVSWEVGVRLAQISEFSLIIAYVSLANHLIGNAAAYLIEATTILTFIVSSYWVVMRYPTPVAVSDRLRRD